jgi:pyridoxamine 5'-phosphate oxidase
VTAAESAAYFRTRPRGSQIGAWTSTQSAVISARSALEEELRLVTERFGDGEVPLPPHWGGYRVVPDEFEFWQGRPNRLHDRLGYRPEGSRWRIERLSP